MIKASLWKKVRRWLKKKPTYELNMTHEIDLALEELRTLNAKQSAVLHRVRQPDILRSLVISMNVGKNS